jgi:hypothetical protein
MTEREQKLRAAVLLIAQTFLVFKVRESGGPNKGEIVEKFLRLQAGHAGQPWCMAFAATVYEIACHILGEDHAVQASLSCGALKSQAIKKKRWLDAKDGRVGDFMILQHADGRAFHVGLIAVPLNSEGEAVLIEGNTNDAGSAEGDGVFKKVRLSSRIRMNAVSIAPL